MGTDALGNSYYESLDEPWGKSSSFSPFSGSSDSGTRNSVRRNAGIMDVPENISFSGRWYSERWRKWGELIRSPLEEIHHHPVFTLTSSMTPSVREKQDVALRDLLLPGLCATFWETHIEDISVLEI